MPHLHENTAQFIPKFKLLQNESYLITEVEQLVIIKIE